jgi:hypothetical protein
MEKGYLVIIFMTDGMLAAYRHQVIDTDKLATVPRFGS